MNEIYDEKGRVKFSTPAKVILIIGASLTGIGLLLSDISFSMVFGVITLSCELWLLIKRVRMPFYILIANSAISLIYAFITLPVFWELWAEMQAEMQDLYATFGLTLNELFFQTLANTVIAMVVMFAVGYLVLIYLLIRKQWAYMPLYSGAANENE